MKKYVLLAMSVILIAGCSGKHQSYEIKGKVNNPDLNNKYVYLYEYGVENPVALDSVLVQNGTFTFTGQQETPVLHSVRFHESEIPLQRVAGGENMPFSSTFVLENGKIAVILDTVSYATGTPENNDLKDLQDFLRSKRAEQGELFKKYQAATDEEKETIGEQYGQVEEQITGRVKDYITAHNNKVSGGKLLYDFRYSLSDDERRDIVDRADATFVSVPTVQPIIDHLNILDKVAVGKKFTDFEMEDPDGVMRSLSDYIGNGKVVLIDFWASWCPPCRAQMPELVRIYDEQKGNGFEIVGVSLDNNKEAWEKGIKDLGITWPQLSDLEYWQNAGAALYGVNSIPALVLVDKEGTIIARNIHGEELEKAIKAAL
ncbi:MAG: AhpC/TSA family protein [Tannerellaceae bacterium]|nr:AhpC/TSA family protein [Tannerellaceae bacterium]